MVWEIGRAYEAANWHHLSYGFIFFVNLVRGRGINIVTSRAPFTPAMYVRIIIECLASLTIVTKLGEVWVADSDTRADVKITRLLWSDLQYLIICIVKGAGTMPTQTPTSIMIAMENNTSSYLLQDNSTLRILKAS